MAEFVVDGVTYRLRKLNAVQEWRLYVLYLPVLQAIAGLEVGIRNGTEGGSSLAAMLHPLLAMDETAMFALIDACAEVCDQDIDGTWSPIDRDMPMHSLITFVLHVAGAALEEFFAVRRSKFTPISRDGALFEPVSMPDGEQWLWRPVEQRMCLAESLYNGDLSLAKIAKLNDVIDVKEENEYRARKAAEREAETRARSR